MNTPSQELQIIEYKEWSDKYLSPQVKAFQQAHNTVIEITTLDNAYELSTGDCRIKGTVELADLKLRRSVRYACYIGVIVESEEVQESHIQQFAHTLNLLAYHGVIKEHVLLGIRGMAIACGDERLQPWAEMKKKADPAYEYKDEDYLHFGPCPRTMLFFYTFSDISTDILRKLEEYGKYFVSEGELPSVILKAK